MSHSQFYFMLFSFILSCPFCFFIYFLSSYLPSCSVISLVLFCSVSFLLVFSLFTSPVLLCLLSTSFISFPVLSPLISHVLSTALSHVLLSIQSSVLCFALSFILFNTILFYLVLSCSILLSVPSHPTVSCSISSPFSPACSLFCCVLLFYSLIA